MTTTTVTLSPTSLVGIYKSPTILSVPPATLTLNTVGSELVLSWTPGVGPVYSADIICMRFNTAISPNIDRRVTAARLRFTISGMASSGGAEVKADWKDFGAAIDGGDFTTAVTGYALQQAFNGTNFPDASTVTKSLTGYAGGDTWDGINLAGFTDLVMCVKTGAAPTDLDTMSILRSSVQLEFDHEPLPPFCCRVREDVV
jgi:hypothetical protein